jgi:hypothetical protein
VKLAIDYGTIQRLDIPISNNTGKLPITHVSTDEKQSIRQNAVTFREWISNAKPIDSVGFEISPAANFSSSSSSPSHQPRI